MGLDNVAQHLWGHHRSRDSGEAMAQTYGRGDVLPALRWQLTVTQAIRGGWLPLTPQVRGARAPVSESCLVLKPEQLESVPMGLRKAADQDDATDDESESESSEVCSCDSGLSDDVKAEYCCCKGLEPHANGQVLPDVHVVNNLTARFHAAVILECGAVRHACVPAKDIDGLRWQVWEEDTSLGVTPFEPCHHLACAQVLRGPSGE